MLVDAEVDTSRLEAASDLGEETVVRPILRQKRAEVGVGDDLEDRKADFSFGR